MVAWWISRGVYDLLKRDLFLGGGNSNIFYVHPYTMPHLIIRIGRLRYTHDLNGNISIPCGKNVAAQFNFIRSLYFNTFNNPGCVINSAAVVGLVRQALSNS